MQNNHEFVEIRISALIGRSQDRALALNKAYRVIVQEQSFVQGRDATVTPVETVHRSVAIDTPTGVREVVSGP